MRSYVSRCLLTLSLAGAVVFSHAQSLQELVRKPVVLRGTLGTEQIQLSLRPKKDEDGLEGSYFVFGQGAQILLAGEVDHDDLMMEESRNGKDVSGEWDGSFKNGVLGGTWSTLDGTVSKAFVLNMGAVDSGQPIVKP